MNTAPSFQPNDLVKNLEREFGFNPLQGYLTTFDNPPEPEETARALISTTRYCEHGLQLTNRGYPEYTGWALLADLQHINTEYPLRTTYRYLQEHHAANPNWHEEHEHNYDQVRWLAHWHYWPDPETGLWMAEYLHTQTVLTLDKWLFAPETT